jgi:hypothetical protein
MYTVAMIGPAPLLARHTCELEGAPHLNRSKPTSAEADGRLEVHTAGRRGRRNCRAGCNQAVDAPVLRQPLPMPNFLNRLYAAVRSTGRCRTALEALPHAAAAAIIRAAPADDPPRPPRHRCPQNRNREAPTRATARQTV